MIGVMGQGVVQRRLDLEAQIRSEGLQPLGIDVRLDGAGLIRPLPGGVSLPIKCHPSEWLSRYVGFHVGACRCRHRSRIHR